MVWVSAKVHIDREEDSDYISQLLLASSPSRLSSGEFWSSPGCILICWCPQMLPSQEELKEFDTSLVFVLQSAKLRRLVLCFTSMETINGAKMDESLVRGTNIRDQTAPQHI